MCWKPIAGDFALEIRKIAVVTIAVECDLSISQFVRNDHLFLPALPPAPKAPEQAGRVGRHGCYTGSRERRGKWFSAIHCWSGPGVVPIGRVKPTGRQADRQTGRQTDRQTTNRETDRQTD